MQCKHRVRLEEPDGHIREEHPDHVHIDGTWLRASWKGRGSDGHDEYAAYPASRVVAWEYEGPRVS